MTLATWHKTFTHDGVTVADVYGNTERRPATYRLTSNPLARFDGYMIGDAWPVTTGDVTTYHCLFVTETHGHRWVVSASGVHVWGPPVAVEIAPPAEHVHVTGDGAISCPCSHRGPITDGFSVCHRDGTDAHTWPEDGPTFYRCDRCGRIIEESTLAVVARLD